MKNREVQGRMKHLFLISFSRKKLKIRPLTIKFFFFFFFLISPVTVKYRIIYITLHKFMFMHLNIEPYTSRYFQNVLWHILSPPNRKVEKVKAWFSGNLMICLHYIVHVIDYLTRYDPNANLCYNHKMK